MLDFGRDICSHLLLAERREWLVTNGIDGYASGTIAGLLTRRYHDLLIAALKPPLGRTLLLTKLDETATYDGHAYPLFANRWAVPILALRYERTREWEGLEGTTPVWTFAWADALLEKRVWMQPGAKWYHSASRDRGVGTASRWPVVRFHPGGNLIGGLKRLAERKQD
jgi:predicted glycogen debranching enzyme